MRLRFCSVSLLLCFLLANWITPISTSAQDRFFEEEQIKWDGIYFLGESTTAHLRRRGTLLGRYAATNVFAPESGTLMLSSRTLFQTIHSASGGKTNIIERIRQEKPQILVLSFGLNGITRFHCEEEQYIRLYHALIQQVLSVSPKTQIALQTIYPVAECQKQWNFSVSPKEVNLWINSLNKRLTEYAETERILLLDTAKILQNENGFLRPEYSADGIHLTSTGYDVVLRFLAGKIGRL